MSFRLEGNKFFWGGEIHFSNPNEPINLSSLLGPPHQRAGWVWSRERALCLPFLTHFFPHVLSPSPAHLFSALTNTRCASKASFSWFPFSGFVSFSGCSITPPTLLSCGAFVIHRREEEEEKRERRGEWVLLFRTDGILCLSGGQNVPARVLLMLNGTGRWIIPCPWTNLKAAQQPGTMGESWYEGGLICPSLHSLFLFPLSLILCYFHHRFCGGNLFFFSLILCLACTHLHIHKQLNNMSSFTSCINSFLGTNC